MTSGERQNFQWRPNDNSATTRLRYDLEAEHWVRSISDATQSKLESNNGLMIKTFGGVLGIALNLLSLIIMGIGALISWGYNQKRKSKVRKESRFVPLTDDELDARMNSGRMKVIDLYGD